MHKGSCLAPYAASQVVAAPLTALLPCRRGKSTLLRLLAKRQLPVPENIDVLLVEQEVVGDDK